MYKTKKLIDISGIEIVDYLEKALFSILCHVKINMKLNCYKIRVQFSSDLGERQPTDKSSTNRDYA